MTKIKYIFALILTMIIIASCEREESFIADDQHVNEPENLLIGNWSVNAYLADQVVFDSINVVITESLGDSITIKDSINNFWSFQVKAAINDLKNGFQTEESVNENSELGIGIKIANGKVIDSDSIYFEISFEDDVTPFGNTYLLQGRRIN